MSLNKQFTPAVNDLLPCVSGTGSYGYANFCRVSSAFLLLPISFSLDRHPSLSIYFLLLTSHVNWEMRKLNLLEFRVPLFSKKQKL